MICTLLYRQGLFFHPTTGALVAVPPDGPHVVQLWDSLGDRDEFFVLDIDGDWVSHAQVRLLPDGRGLYHDDIDGYELIFRSEIEDWQREGFLVREILDDSPPRHV